MVLSDNEFVSVTVRAGGNREEGGGQNLKKGRVGNMGGGGHKVGGLGPLCQLEA